MSFEVPHDLLRALKYWHNTYRTYDPMKIGARDQWRAMDEELLRSLDQHIDELTSPDRVDAKADVVATATWLANSDIDSVLYKSRFSELQEAVSKLNKSEVR